MAGNMIENLIYELKTRKIPSSMKNIEFLAKIWYDMVNENELEDKIREPLKEMVSTGKLIEIKTRSDGNIFIKPETNCNKKETENQSEKNENNRFREEIMDIVNMMYKGMEYFQEHMRNELSDVKQIPSSSPNEKKEDFVHLQIENKRLKDEIKTKNQIIQKLLTNENTNEVTAANSNYEILTPHTKDSPIKRKKDDNNALSKEKPPLTARKVVIIGDSMLNALDEKRMSSNSMSVKVRNHPGATSLDVIDHLRPTIRQNPDVIVIHAGTNDITKNINYLKNVKLMVKEIRQKSEKTQIVFSTLFRRFDIKDGEKQVDDINFRLKNFCQQNDLKLIDNGNITKDLIGKRKLHPTLKGSSVFAKNI